MLRSLFFAALLSMLAGVGAFAQTPVAASAQASPPASAAAAQPSAQQNLAKAQAALKSVAEALSRDKLNDIELQNLRDALDPATVAANAAMQDVAPRIAAVKARLSQLGPVPAAGAPAEAPEIAAERAKAQKDEAALDAELTQAKLALVDASQLASRISTLRSNLFVSDVFAQSYSILSPALWSQVASETPDVVRSIVDAFSSWSERAFAQLDGWTWFVFLGALAVVGAIYYVGAVVARRILNHDSATREPTRFMKALAALWVAFLTALAPILTTTALVLALRYFGLADPTADPFLREVVFAVVRISLALAIARGLLAPTRPEWRLLDLTTPTCERLLALIVAVATVMSLGRILDTVADQIAFSVAMSSAIRSLTALASALTMALFLRGIVPDEEEADDCLGPKTKPATDWYAPLRLAIWATIGALLVAVVAGYVAFSAFLLRQLAWIALVGAGLYITVILANEGVAAAFKPNSFVGRGLTRSLGFRRESLSQFSVVVSGVATLAACVTAGLLVLAPWGVESSDMLSGLQAAYFGFHVGGVTISLSAIVVAGLLFALGLLATRWIQRWFDTRLLPATQIDVGLRNSIRTSVGYLGVIGASMLAMGRLGVDFQKIAIVAGALSVGIGFGLQSIVNNFVSGLIILWERVIRVGDLVVVGDDQGHVKRISVRATEIETFDRVTMIVPNSNLVTGVVKNWVRGDRMARIKIPLSFATGPDPETVRDVLIDCARDNSMVVKLPAPQALLTSIDGALKFQLVCFVSEVETAGRVTSDLNFELYRRLKEAGLEAPAAAPAPTPVNVQIQGLKELVAQAQREERGSGEGEEKEH